MTARLCAVGMHGHGDGHCDCPNCRELLVADLASNEQLDAAINLVAGQVMARLAEGEIGDAWGLYPEIAEHDWLAIQDRVLFLVSEMRPEPDQYADAYALLESRAAAWDEDFR